MDLKKYIDIIWRRKWVILATTFITTLVVFVGTQFYSFPYEATTILRVATSRTGQASYEDLLYADRLLRTFAQIANGSTVKEDLVRLFDLNQEPAIEVQVLPNTELIRITITHPNPVLARDIANTLATMVIRQRQEIDNRLNLITIIDPAVTPKSPTVSEVLILAIGIFVGLVAGLGLVFIFQNLDNKLYSSEEIEVASDLTLLGSIPTVKKDKVLLKNNSPRYYEIAYQNLRTNILVQNHNKPPMTLLVTSTAPGDGKSTVVANLALSISRTQKKVVIVDGDMRKPKLHSIFQIPNQMGLSSILAGEHTLDEFIQEDETPISVITSGPVSDDPTLLLNSENLSWMIKELKMQFDFILIDSPAFFAVPDAGILARHADGIILVINKTMTSKGTILECNRYLNEVQSKALGMVINKVKPKDSYYYG